MAELRIQDSGSGLDVLGGGLVLAHLATGEGIASGDTPKPHIHPLRTPGGVLITGFAPEDHPWHHGLQFAMPRVGPHNLWGGGTFVDLDVRYQVLDDHGELRHRNWDPAVQGSRAQVGEQVTWLGHSGELLIDERRRWTFTSTAAGGGDAFVVDFSTVLHNPGAEDLPLETPAQRGRPDGGYGGLFLRLGDGFTADRLLGDDAPLTGSGSPSRTLVVHGRTGDGVAVTLGLSFREGKTPGIRKWLYRFDPFASIGWAVAYDDGLLLKAGGSLSFDHRLVLCDGHVDAEAMRALL